MKKNSVFAVSAITVAFLLLAAVAAYITIDYFQSRVVSQTVNLETEFRFLMEEDVLEMDAAKASSAQGTAAVQADRKGSDAVAGQKGADAAEPQTNTSGKTGTADTDKANAGGKDNTSAAVLEETLPDPAGKSGSAAKSASVTADGKVPAAELTVTEEPAAIPEHQIIWVGDSRTVSLGKTVKDDCVFIGADGEGYDWQVKTGDSLLRKAIADAPKAPVVFGFGVNDYDNMNLYLEYYKKLVKELPDTDFWFLSINPIDPARCEVITNMEIADFNAHLKEAFPDRYLNTFTWLMVNEAITVDGIHYDEPTNQALHDVVVGAINGITILYG